MHHYSLLTFAFSLKVEFKVWGCTLFWQREIQFNTNEMTDPKAKSLIH